MSIETNLCSALPCLIELQWAKARGPADQLTLSLPPSPGYGGTGLACARTHSQRARSGCALSLREILFLRSQRVQIAGQLVPQDPTDDPARKLLAGIQKTKGGNL